MTLLLHGPLPNIHPVIDEEIVRKIAINTTGGSGPSGMDVEGYHRILVSNQFGTSNTDMCKTFAEVIRRLCMNLIKTKYRSSFVFRLMPLDTNPRLRPIGVGEVLRYMASKVTVSLLKEDVIETTGSLQVYEGQDTAIEAAIYSMNEMYNAEETGSMLLADVKNAFNSVNK